MGQIGKFYFIYKSEVFEFGRNWKRKKVIVVDHFFTQESENRPTIEISLSSSC